MKRNLVISYKLQDYIRSQLPQQLIQTNSRLPVTETQSVSDYWNLKAHLREVQMATVEMLRSLHTTYLHKCLSAFITLPEYKSNLNFEALNSQLTLSAVF